MWLCNEKDLHYSLLGFLYSYSHSTTWKKKVVWFPIAYWGNHSQFNPTVKIACGIGSTCIRATHLNRWMPQETHYGHEDNIHIYLVLLIDMFSWESQSQTHPKLILCRWNYPNQRMHVCNWSHQKIWTPINHPYSITRHI